MPKGVTSKTCTNHECSSFNKPAIVNTAKTKCGCGAEYPRKSAA